MQGVAAPVVAFVSEAAAAPAVGSVAGRLAVDLVALGVLLLLARLRGRSGGGLVFALVALNVGLFATVVAISGEAFSAGAGFGLFGMLSLIRLRSASFSTPDMAYTFIAVVLGLVTALVDLPLWLTIGAAGVLAVVPALADRGADADVEPPAGQEPAPTTRRVDVVLDGAYGTLAQARAEIERRLGVTVLEVALDEVDYVREVTRVRVTVPAPGGQPLPRTMPPAPPGHPGSVVAGPWGVAGQRLPHQAPPPPVSAPTSPLPPAPPVTTSVPAPPAAQVTPATTGHPAHGSDLGAELGLPGAPAAPHVAAPTFAQALGLDTGHDPAAPGRRARRLRTAPDAADPGESGRLPRLLGPSSGTRR